MVRRWTTGYSAGLGQNWHKVEQYSDTLQVTVAVLVAVALVWFVASRLRKRKQVE